MQLRRGQPPVGRGETHGRAVPRSQKNSTIPDKSCIFHPFSLSGFFLPPRRRLCCFSTCTCAASALRDAASAPSPSTLASAAATCFFFPSAPRMKRFAAPTSTVASLPPRRRLRCGGGVFTAGAAAALLGGAAPAPPPSAWTSAATCFFPSAPRTKRFAAPTSTVAWRGGRLRCCEATNEPTTSIAGIATSGYRLPLVLDGCCGGGGG